CCQQPREIGQRGNGSRRKVQRFLVMLDGFRRVALFLKSNSQRRVTICIRRAEQECTPANLDGTVEFAFLQQGMTETVTSEKVIGVYRYCLLVVSDCFVNPALLKKSIAQRDQSIRIRWSHPHCPFTVEYRLVHLTFSH